MYKELGRFGSVNFRGIRYVEDVMMEKEKGYRLGFDIIIIPEIRVSNNYTRVLIAMKWLSWELIWFRYKDIITTVDFQGRASTEYHGVRYFLSLRWLLRR